MPNPSPKEIAIGTALEEIFTVIGRPLENGDRLIKAWVKWLPTVPAESVQAAFDLAMSKGGRSAIPTPDRVTAAYREIKQADNWTVDNQDAIEHPQEYYQAAIDKCKVDYPEFTVLFQSIDLNDSRPLEPRQNTEDSYFLRIFTKLYNDRIGKLADKLGMPKMGRSKVGAYPRKPQSKLNIGGYE